MFDVRAGGDFPFRAVDLGEAVQSQRSFLAAMT